MTKIPLHLFKTLIAVLLLNLLGIFSASAHEVSPSIADITVTDNQIEIEIRLMAEAVLAEIDLSETTDTNGFGYVGALKGKPHCRCGFVK